MLTPDPLRNLSDFPDKIPESNNFGDGTMSISDKEIRQEAKVLEGMVERHDYNGLHNKLVADSHVANPEEFNKLMSAFKELNSEARKNNGFLPSVELHNEGGFLGFGANTDQVVLKDNNSGRKMEVYENDQHRQNEVAAQERERQGGSLDLFRQIYKATSSEWVGRPDFQQDSSVPWQQRNNRQNFHSYMVTDHRNHNTGHAYDAAQDVQNRINNGQPLHTNAQWRYERMR